MPTDVSFKVKYMDLCDFCVINKNRLLKSARWNKNLDF